MGNDDFVKAVLVEGEPSFRMRMGNILFKSPLRAFPNSRTHHSIESDVETISFLYPPAISLENVTNIFKEALKNGDLDDQSLSHIKIETKVGDRHETRTLFL